MNNLPKVVTR